MLKPKVEKVLEEKVRPFLRRDGGDIIITEFSEATGELKVRLLGHCSGCPSAQYTTETLVEREILAAIPEIKSVVLDTGVSEELLDFTRKILNHEVNAG